MSEEIKPCPFCFERLELQTNGSMTERSICCENCNMQFYAFDSENTEEFLERWNDPEYQSELSTLRAKVAELEGEKKEAFNAARIISASGDTHCYKYQTFDDWQKSKSESLKGGEENGKA